jgi:putative membrane protein
MSTPPEIIAFVAGFPILLAHLGIGIGAWLVWGFIYTVCSRGQEISQIRDGNGASGILYGVTLFALALPLAHSLSAANGWLDMAVWSGSAGLLQLTLFAITDLVLAGLSGRVRDTGDVSAAILLGSARLATAWLLSSALTL